MPTTEKELLFNDLLQPHWDKFTHEVKALVAQHARVSKVFISYVWPSSRYPGYDAEKDIQVWLLGLYQRLAYLGAAVLFDIKTMRLGTNIDQFMQ